MSSVNPDLLSQFEPISTLSVSRQKELAGLCFIERVSKEIDPLRLNIMNNAQFMYLVKGDLGVRFKDGSKKILRAGTPPARYAIDTYKMALQDTVALTEIEIIRIDLDLLDIMLTWDQLANAKSENKLPLSNRLPYGNEINQIPEWMRNTNMFGIDKLKSGIFSRLPSSSIEEMFRRVVYEEVEAGQNIIMQGSDGEFFYIIESGTANVSRMTQSSKTPEFLAKLHAGDSFGEEALVSDAKRNATVTMDTKGALLKLKKSDFVELLKAPLLMDISLDDANERIQQGAIWIDVRFPSEFKYDPMPGAINIPLNQLRASLSSLDKSKEYLTYCQTGRRSAAAAFILLQHGFNVHVLKRKRRY